MKKINKKNGFTLIELMIVVAIVAVLSASATAAYQNYIIRSQIIEGFELMEGAKTSEAEYYATHGQFTEVADLLGGSMQGKYVSNIATLIPYTDPFALRVNYQQPATNSKIREGGYITFYAKVDVTTGTIRWTCVPDGIYIVPKYLPSSVKCDNN